MARGGTKRHGEAEIELRSSHDVLFLFQRRSLGCPDLGVQYFSEQMNKKMMMLFGAPATQFQKGQ